MEDIKDRQIPTVPSMLGPCAHAFGSLINWKLENKKLLEEESNLPVKAAHAVFYSLRTVKMNSVQQFVNNIYCFVSIIQAEADKKRQEAQARKLENKQLLEEEEANLPVQAAGVRSGSKFTRAEIEANQQKQREEEERGEMRGRLRLSVPLYGSHLRKWRAESRD